MIEFHPKAWLGSLEVRSLSLEERGRLIDTASADALRGVYTPFLRPQCRTGIPREVRLAVLARDGWKCVRCGSPDRLEMDHVVAWSSGGADTIDNLKTLCWLCNRRKGASE